MFKDQGFPYVDWRVRRVPRPHFTFFGLLVCRDPNSPFRWGQEPPRAHIFPTEWKLPNNRNHLFYVLPLLPSLSGLVPRLLNAGDALLWLLMGLCYPG